MSVRRNNVKTVSQLAKDAKGIVNGVRRTGRPVMVTVAGKPGVVIVDAASYEKQLRDERLTAMLLEGEADIQAGRVRPFDEFVRELNLGKKVSSRNHLRR